jgi:hypothetical protein
MKVCRRSKFLLLAAFVLGDVPDDAAPREFLVQALCGGLSSWTWYQSPICSAITTGKRVSQAGLAVV